MIQVPKTLKASSDNCLFCIVSSKTDPTNPPTNLFDLKNNASKIIINDKFLLILSTYTSITVPKDAFLEISISEKIVVTPNMAQFIKIGFIENYGSHRMCIYRIRVHGNIENL
ncbi:hypothetical protein A3Q56_08382, partial [Intoshia linei]